MQLIILTQHMQKQVQTNSCQNKIRRCQTHSIGVGCDEEMFSPSLSPPSKATNIQLSSTFEKCNQINQIGYQDYYQSIGVIKTVQIGENGQPTQINFGTAFAVGKKLIMTCSHNIYSQQKSTFCTQAIFYPNIKEGSLQKQVGYKSQSNKFYHCRRFRYSLSYKPLKQQICFIVLNEELPIKNFIQIDQLVQKTNYQKQKLSIIGYPSLSQKINDIQVSRKQSFGQIHSLDNYVINHTISTECGQSGSPILCQNESGKWKAIGIHTHKGISSEYNSGVYFNEEIIQIIKKLLQQIQQQHKEQEICNYKKLLQSSKLSQEKNLDSQLQLQFTTNQLNLHKNLSFQLESEDQVSQMGDLDIQQTGGIDNQISNILEGFQPCSQKVDQAGNKTEDKQNQQKRYKNNCQDQFTIQYSYQQIDSLPKRQITKTSQQHNQLDFYQKAVQCHNQILKKQSLSCQQEELSDQESFEAKLEQKQPDFIQQFKLIPKLYETIAFQNQIEYQNLRNYKYSWSTLQGQRETGEQQKPQKFEGYFQQSIDPESRNQEIQEQQFSKIMKQIN